MAWRAIHEVHAIDRVRVMLQFNEALNDKLLQKAATPVANRYAELGFETVGRAEGVIQTIVPDQNLIPLMPPIRNGWVLKRGNETEEAGFRDLVFGYLSTEYGRWENLENRFWEIFREALTIALESVDLAQVKLEYWDRFIFDGDPVRADARSLLADVDPSVPSTSVAGATLWHSHTGWFEQWEGNPVLINRNFDVIDQTIDGEVRRVMNIFTLVELRPNYSMKVAEVEDGLKYLHDRALLLLGTSLREEFRRAIGFATERLAI